LHRITANREDDWNRRSRPFGSESAGVATRNEHRHLTANEISRQRGQTIELTFRKTVFDRHVLALDISGCVQSTTECVERNPQRVGRPGDKESDHRHRRLLRARRERPCGRRAAEERDEFAPFH